MTQEQTIFASRYHYDDQLHETFHHEGMKQILNSPARVQGQSPAYARRWGKTESGKRHLILHNALVEKKRCWWLTPTRQMSSQVWRDLKNSIKRLKGAKISETERRIDLPDAAV